MFKQIAYVESVNMGSAGDPQAIVKFQKQQAQFTKCWIDGVKISYLVDDIAGLPTEYIDYGVLFAVTNHNTNNPSSANVVSARAAQGGANTVYLPVKRSIVDDDFDADSGDHALALWAELPDITATADITLKLVIEAFGRWHTVEAL